MSRHNAALALKLEDRPPDMRPADAPVPADLPPGLELELLRIGAVLVDACRAYAELAEARGQGRIALRHAASRLSRALAPDPKAMAGHVERTIARTIARMVP